MASSLPTLYINRELTMPDNDQWHHRFEIHSESSNRVYVIAQHKTKRYWGCSCPGWKAHRTCKHLQAMNLPVKEKPYEVNIVRV